MKPGDKRREAKKAGIKNAQKRNRQNRDQLEVNSIWDTSIKKTL